MPVEDDAESPTMTMTVTMATTITATIITMKGLKGDGGRVQTHTNGFRNRNLAMAEQMMAERQSRTRCHSIHES
jgi:hypothetical protein